MKWNNQKHYWILPNCDNSLHQRSMCYMLQEDKLPSSFFLHWIVTKIMCVKVLSSLVDISLHNFTWYETFLLMSFRLVDALVLLRPNEASCGGPQFIATLMLACVLLLIAHIGHMNWLSNLRCNWVGAASMGSTSDLFVHGNPVVHDVSIIWGPRDLASFAKRTRASSRNVAKISFLPSEAVKEESLSSFHVLLMGAAKKKKKNDHNRLYVRML